MRLKLLEDEREIGRAQRKLEQTIRREFPSSERRVIGYPGGHVDNAEIWTLGPYWYYKGVGGRGSPRYWNWFGELKDRGALHIAFEANVPTSGNIRRVNGFLARDETTNTSYLMHSGGIGGGTKGIGKTSFLAWLGHKPVEVLDSTGKSRWGVIIMPVEGKSATASAIRYLKKVSDYKRVVKAGKLGTREFRRNLQLLRDYQEEARGRRTGFRRSRIDYVSRHGEVVDALHAWRNKQGLRPRARIVNSVFLDLGVTVEEILIEAYEVKTSTSRDHLYSAIGQALVHGRGKKCRRWLVLPDDSSIPQDILQAIDDLGVSIVSYSISGKGVVIHDT
jgi:hypothetical protein